MSTYFAEVGLYTPELLEENVMVADKLIVAFMELGLADAVQKTPAWRLAMDQVDNDDIEIRRVACDMLLRLLNIDPARVNRYARYVDNTDVIAR